MEFSEEFPTIEKHLIEQAQKMHMPVHGSIELLPLCNMNCDMCYVRLSKEEMERQGRLHTAEEWLDIAEQMMKSGVLFLLLTGGEPLLYPDFKYLYQKLKQMGMILTINTNGTLIDEEWADFFGRYKPRRINVTLYGANNHTYEKMCHYPNGYEKVIRGIRLLKERGVDVKIGVSIINNNVEDLGQLLELEKKLDTPVRVDTYMMPAARERKIPFDKQVRLGPVQAAGARIRALRCEMGEQLFGEYVQHTLEEIEQGSRRKAIPQRMTCLAGSCSFSVNWQGRLHPCVILTEPSADVFEVGFDSSWKYLREQIDKIYLNAACTSCNMRPLCRTCAACALLEEGSFDAIPEYMCEYTKESLRLLKQIKCTE